MEMFDAGASLHRQGRLRGILGDEKKKKTKGWDALTSWRNKPNQKERIFSTCPSIIRSVVASETHGGMIQYERMNVRA